MKFKDILKDNPFAILLICIATAFSGVTFVFSIITFKRSAEILIVKLSPVPECVFRAFVHIFSDQSFPDADNIAVFLPSNVAA